MKRSNFIKGYKRKDGQFVKGHYRKNQEGTYKKGYMKAVRDIYYKFNKIANENKEHYWKWQFLGVYLKEILGEEKGK